ncbi:MAG TPA: signal peptidase II [Firmicutes bacterium]|jgi:signal peptidase II|nr:signal peptidase II [Bacillota bacterium]
MAYVFLALAVLALDRLLKVWVVRAFPLWSSRPLLGNWLHLTHVRNTGAAFGLFGGNALLLAAISMGFFVCLFFWREHLRLFGTWGRVALALIVGGALGNMYDRLVYGYVIDFVDLRWWPVFNLADSAVVVGALLLVATLWRQEVGR